MRAPKPTHFSELVAPVGTPAAIVTRLNTLLNEGLENPEIKATLIKVGLTVQPCTPIEFAAFIASQHQRWLEVGKAANISIE